MWASDDSECLTAAYLKYIQVKTCDGNMFIDPTIPNNNYWSQGSLWRKWLYMCFVLCGFESSQGFLFHIVPDSSSLSVLTSCHIFTIKSWIKRYKNKQTRTFFQHLSFNLASDTLRKQYMTFSTEETSIWAKGRNHWNKTCFRDLRNLLSGIFRAFNLKVDIYRDRREALGDRKKSRTLWLCFLVSIMAY